MPDTRGSVLQLHASRHCNLSCSHCYSDSGPRHRSRLPLKMLRDLFADAVDAGYEVLSLSGGEPFLDPDLPLQVAAARAAGLGVNLVTNGTLLRPDTLARLAPDLGIVAVSLDGPPQLHDAIRGAGQFAQTERGLRALRESGLTLAIIHTVRPASLAHLSWLVSYARDQGAQMLHLHPIEAVGRAAAPGAIEPGADVATRLALLTPWLAPQVGELQLQVDVLPIEALPHAVDLRLALEAPLAHSIDPLVVEPDGTLSPFVFGFPRALGVGNLQRASLGAQIGAFKAERLVEVCAHVANVRANLQAHRWPFANWHEHLARVPADDGASLSSIV